MAMNHSPVELPELLVDCEVVDCEVVDRLRVVDKLVVELTLDWLVVELADVRLSSVELEDVLRLVVEFTLDRLVVELTELRLDCDVVLLTDELLERLEDVLTLVVESTLDWLVVDKLAVVLELSVECELSDWLDFDWVLSVEPELRDWVETELETLVVLAELVDSSSSAAEFTHRRNPLTLPQIMGRTVTVAVIVHSAVVRIAFEAVPSGTTSWRPTPRLPNPVAARTSPAVWTWIAIWEPSLPTRASSTSSMPSRITVLAGMATARSCVPTEPPWIAGSYSNATYPSGSHVAPS
jgi:hypothetical protein